MNKLFIKKMKVSLEEEKSRLEKQIGQLSGQKAVGDKLAGVEWLDIGTKDDENAVEVAAYQDNLSLEQKLQQTFNEVNTALKKIVEGTYGVCVKCGKGIDEKRLEVFPAATQHTQC